MFHLRRGAPGFGDVKLGVLIHWAMRLGLTGLACMSTWQGRYGTSNCA
jgi:hypothetical protein